VVLLADFFRNHLEAIDKKETTLEDIEAVRLYTGKTFSAINSILKGTWDYDINGELTLERKEYYESIIKDIKSVFARMRELPNNIVTYRGSNIREFKNFGVSSLSDLVCLKGEYIYKSDFTSTALLRDRSFFDNSKVEFGGTRDIEIQFLIPKESNDGIPIVGADMSYSLGQTEYLINSGSLIKIVDVILNEDESKAFIKAVYIPKKVYDREKIEVDSYIEDSKKSYS